MRLWVDGRVVAPEEARVPALDHGFTVGDGAFETAKVVDGVPFALSRHLRRLAASAAGLGLAAPDDGLVREAVSAVVEACASDGEPAGRLRVTYTAGPGPLGSNRGAARPTLVVAAAPVAPWPERVTVVTAPWPRNERGALAGLKTTSYAENVVALAYAVERGGSEALVANTRGELCEGTGSNVVVAVDGELVTPPLDSGCLAGITRELLLQWAAEAGRPVGERTVPLEALATAEEVLLLSSTRDVQPVDVVDGREVARGPLGAEAAALFTERAAADLDP